MLSLICLVAAILPAQSTAFGVIVYAEGEEFQLVRDDRPRQYNAYHPDVLGMPLYAGDRIDTYDSTYLEVQLMPARSIVKIAENTSFVVQGVTDGGGGQFELAYGRVRARVERLVGTDAFEIRSRTAVAGVRGTDFGYDLVAGRGSQAVANVYCFEGAVEVTLAQEPQPEVGTAEAAPEPDAAPDRVQRVELGANEMVSIAEPRMRRSPESAPTAAVPEDGTADAIAAPTLTKQVLEPQIATFWEEKTFQESPLEPAELAQRFPSLQETVSERLGEVPEFLVQAAPEPEPVSQQAVEEEQPEPPRAVAISPQPTDLPVGETAPETREQRRERISNASRVTGWILVGGGAVSEVVGVGLRLFGDQLVPSLGGTDTLERTLIITGGVYLGGGLLSLALSLLFSD